MGERLVPYSLYRPASSKLLSRPPRYDSLASFLLLFHPPSSRASYSSLPLPPMTTERYVSFIFIVEIVSYASCYPKGLGYPPGHPTCGVGPRMRLHVLQVMLHSDGQFMTYRTYCNYPHHPRPPGSPRRPPPYKLLTRQSVINRRTHDNITLE